MAILHRLLSTPVPATAEQLNEEVGAGCCNRITICRALRALETHRIIRRVFFQGRAAAYEINRPTIAVRYYFQCKQSHELEELDEELCQVIRGAVAVAEEKLRVRGFAKVGHMLKFVGTAPPS